MVEIKTVIILKTPFHQKSIEHLFPTKFYCENTLLLHDASLAVDHYTCKKRKLTEYDFSRQRIFKNPIKFFRPLRKKINEIDTEIAEISARYSFSQNTIGYLGSDKDIFTQLFLITLKNKFYKVIAVDEGLGYYVRLSLKDHLIAFIYRSLTPLLFGKRISFIKRLGTLSCIDTVYLRNVALLPSKVKGIEYLEFQMKSRQFIKPIVKGKVLLFSFPEQDLNYNANKKISLYVGILDQLREHGRRLVIKPHPRENVTYLRQNLKNSNVEFLDEKQLGEALQYFDYECIINVFSSVILDIVDSSYPKNRLLTLGYTKTPPMKFDGQLRYIPLSQFQAGKHLLLEKT